MPMVHRNAAAIDVGATMHMAAVRADRTPEPVRSFGTFTTDLHRDQYPGMVMPVTAVENPLGEDSVGTVRGSAVVEGHPICVKEGTGLSWRGRQI
jgi:hypothetical protein